jgi:hypothetical protein
MEVLDFRFVRKGEMLQLTADLSGGWKRLKANGQKPEYMGFDEQIFVPNRSDPKYKCHLYVVAVAPCSRASTQTFPGIKCTCKLGFNEVSIDGPTMTVDVPLNKNKWAYRKSGKLMIYEVDDRLFSVQTPDGLLNYRALLWVTNEDPQ